MQAVTPALLRRQLQGDEQGSARDAEPDGRTAMVLTFALAAFPAGIALALAYGMTPQTALVAGLIAFGVIFALNSAVHSYLILAYTEGDTVAMNVGFYYMPNACGQLLGTVLSGLLYQLTGPHARAHHWWAFSEVAQRLRGDSRGASRPAPARHPHAGRASNVQ